MQSSLPQTEIDPRHRPKGCINSYKSVVNTANNGLLVRSRIREVVLCCGILIGFQKNTVRASYVYKREKSIKKCTFLYAKSMLSPHVQPEMENALINLPSDIFCMLRHYYIYDGSDFYDTKKFRIYKKRLEHGQPDENGHRKMRLTHVIQYMSTPLLACIFALYGGKIIDPKRDKIDLIPLKSIRYALDKNETGYQIQKYIDTVLKIPNLTIEDGRYLVFKTEEARKAFWNIANSEAKILHQELEEGGYLEERERKVNAG